VVGMVSGGENVTITGTLFAASVRVMFGNSKAGGVTRVNATTITCKAPAQNVAGGVNVSVTNDPSFFFADGPTANWANQFWTFPEITSIEPSEISTNGGTPVTIEGKGFPVGARVVVPSGGADYPATAVVRVSATRITCQPPQHPAGKLEIRVLHPLPENRAIPADLHYCEPLISSLSPSKGRPGGGTDVTITGKHFHAHAQVHFDVTLSPAIVFNSSTELTAQTPPHAAGRVDVRITNPLAAAVVGPPAAPAVPANPMTMTNGYEYGDSEVLSIEPKKGPVAGGTNVTIKGRGLLAPAPNGVQIGGVAAINENCVNDTTVTATTTAAAVGPANISVQNNLGDAAAALANGFTFVALAMVTGVNPEEGPEGTPVTIQGTNFEEGAAVRFGGQNATNIQVVSSTAIRCTTPAHANGAVQVEVQNDSGDSGSLANGYTYTHFRIDPARGLPAGLENVTIHMPVVRAPAPQVSLDGNVAAPVGGGAFVVTTPAHVAGQVNVTVGADTLANGFEYSPITSIEPDAGAAATTVNIYGAGFDGTTAVAFDGNNAAPVVVVSPNQIRVPAPAHAAGPVNVVVTNAGAGTFANGFTYQPALTVTGIEPATGTNAGGTEITITGTGFVKGNATADIAGIAANNVVVVSPTTITATTPPAAGPGPYVAVAVAVQNPGAAAAVGGGNLWTYRNAPTVNALANPGVGPNTGGRSITVTGTDFVDGAQVMVGGNPATDVDFINVATLRCRVPAHAAGQVPIAVQNPGDPTPGPARANSFQYVADPHTPTGQNEVRFLRDGERFFLYLQRGFEAVRQAAPDPDGLTYVRLAYWMADDDVTVGPRAHFGKANHQLLKYVEQVARAGHHVEIILWRPNAIENKVSEGKGVYAANQTMATKLYDIDVAMAAVEGAGRVRVYFEHSEGETGSSLHQKIAIFSIAGVRRAIIGGLNLSLGYFGSDDHAFPPLAAPCSPWHDASIYVRGPATDDIEREWMRRWYRTRALEATWWGFANLYGYSGEFLSRDFSFFTWATVRQREIETKENTQNQPVQAQNTEVTIAVTRSVGATYHTHIRDKVIERINAANNYIYFENYHFCDPDLVQAIVARHGARSAAAADLRVAIVVPHPMGPDSSYLTRRAWLHFALTFEDGTTAPPTPYCTRVVYDTGGGATTVMRAACGANWNVVDCYNPGAPTATNWLENDTLTFNAGAGPVTVNFHQILAVESAIHFYCPLYVDGAGGDNTVYTHSKVAAFDDQWLVVGSANWSYRSMRYDAEISAVVDSGAITAPAIAGLLAHYNPGIAAPTPLNLEAAAVANEIARPLNQIRLYPYEYYNPGAALGPNNPSLPFSQAVPPSPGLTNIQAFIANPSTPNYTWL